MELPLTRWFLAIHLITQSKTGLSALELKRQIHVSYNTAWNMKQKMMQVMKERDDSQPLSGTIQLDDVYWGGELRGGSRGRGSKNKTPFVAAVSINEAGHPVAMNMNVVKGFRLKEISRWAKRHLQAGSTVYSDGLACFTAVKEAECEHISIVTGCLAIFTHPWAAPRVFLIHLYTPIFYAFFSQPTDFSRFMGFRGVASFN